MPAFETSVAPQAPVQQNPLFDATQFQTAMAHNQLANVQAQNALAMAPGQIALQQQQVEAGQMANEYTRQTQQPSINMLLDNYKQFNDPNTAPGMGAQTGQPSGALQPGQSLFSGDMPVSKDQQAQQMVGQIAFAKGVNPEWAMRVQHQESGTYPDSMAATSKAGARGTMQLMPATAASMKAPDGSPIDPNDPLHNAMGGVDYLAQMKKEFGDPVLATAAYNAGPGAVHAFLEGKSPLPHETVDYVGKVFGNHDGGTLLASALGGAHGHPIPGYQVASAGNSINDASGAPQQQAGAFPGMQTVQMDPVAQQSVKQLLTLRNIAMAQPKGAGMRAVAGIQAQLDNIAGPGGIVTNSGVVMRVPGADATRYAASRATEAGKVGPEVEKARQTTAITEASNIAQHAANAATDTQQQAMRPQKLSPGEKLVVPNSVGAVGGTTASGVYTAPGVDDKAASAAEGERAVKIQEPIIDQAKESQTALNRIGQLRAAIQGATKDGLPPGYFSPEVARVAAAAKSLGMDLTPLGIGPNAVPNQQVLNEAATQVNGEMLKRMFPSRITNMDAQTFGKNLVNAGMDPAAIDPILNQAEQAARYDVDKSNHMLAYKGKQGNLLGWEGQFYPQHGYGPNLFDAVNAKTVPAPSGGATPAATPAPTAQAAPAPVAAPPAAVAHLQAHPELAAAFDQKFGPGAAARVMGR